MTRSELCRKFESGIERAAAVVRAGDALARELGRGRRLERVLVDDVAREQSLHLAREHRAGASRVLRVGGRRERAREAVQAADAVLQRLDQRLVLVPQRPRRRDRLRALDVELLLVREAGDALLDLGLLQPLLEQHLAELLADLLRGAGDVGDLAHVALVGLVLARSPGSSAPRARAGRRSGSRRRSGRSAATAASGSSAPAAAAAGRAGRVGGSAAPSASSPRSEARPRRSRNRCRCRFRSWGAGFAGKSRLTLPGRTASAGFRAARRNLRSRGRGGACPFHQRARRRAVSAPAPARQRRLRVGLARPRRAHRARSRAEDRPARGQGGHAGRARGAGGRAAAARALPARLRARPRLAQRLHRLRVRAGADDAPGAAGRRAGRRGRGRDGRAGARGSRARARARDRPPRREAVERAAGRGRRAVGAAARLRARAARRGGVADRHRRRAWNARLRAARAARARRVGRAAGRHLGGRGDALGVARRLASVLERLAARDGEADRDRRRAARTGAARPAEAALRARRPDAVARSCGQAARGAPRPRAARRLRRAAAPAQDPHDGSGAVGAAPAGGTCRRGAVRRLDRGDGCRSTRRSSHRCSP